MHQCSRGRRWLGIDILAECFESFESFDGIHEYSRWEAETRASPLSSSTWPLTPTIFFFILQQAYAYAASAGRRCEKERREEARRSRS